MMITNLEEAKKTRHHTIYFQNQAQKTCFEKTYALLIKQATEGGLNLTETDQEFLISKGCCKI